MDVAVAFDVSSGRELWRHAFAPAWRGRDGSFDGPISTPALGGGRVYGLGPQGHLFALEAATGREVWKVDLVAREGAATPHWGFTSSPLLVGGVLVVGLGGKDAGTLAGFDPQTGAKLWTAGHDEVAYQSPVVLEIAGREHVLGAGNTKLIVVDPASGRLLLEHLHGGERHPLAAESMVPVPAGEGRVYLKLKQDLSSMVRIAPAAGGGLRVETLWIASVLRSTYVVPAYHAGHLYGMNGRATLVCVDAATGTVRWRSRAPGDGFPLLVGGDLVVLTKDSSLHIGAASPDGWRERARIALFGDVVWSPPGFAEGAFFARGQ
jgi:outer membrane protein assembly factor BamB